MFGLITEMMGILIEHVDSIVLLMLSFELRTVFFFVEAFFSVVYCRKRARGHCSSDL